MNSSFLNRSGIYLNKIFVLLWGVLLCNTACDAILEVPDISNNTIELIAPADGSTLTTTNLSFSWEAVADAEAYEIQIASPDFTNVTQLITDSILSETRFNQTLISGDYTWRVRAVNSDFATAYSTNNFSILIQDVDNTIEKSITD